MSDTKKKKKDFTMVSTDQSFIFYDSLARRVWMKDGKRPIVRVTGSHRHSCLFDTIGLEGNENSFSYSTRYSMRYIT